MATAPPAVRGRLLVLHALVESLFGDVTAVGPLLDEGRPLLPDDDEFEFDRALAAVAGIGSAVAAGSLAAMRRAVAEAKAHFVALGLPLGQAYMEMASGDVALVAGDLAAAGEHYAATEQLARRLGAAAMVGQAQSMRGLALLTAGNVGAGRQSVIEGAIVNHRGGQPSSIAYSLEGLAAVALADGRPAVAARALAAAAATRQQTGTPLTPALPPLVNQLMTRAREQLGDDAYAEAWSDGYRWPVLEALDRTLEELTLPVDP
jgi:hypothetical protein